MLFHTEAVTDGHDKTLPTATTRRRVEGGRGGGGQTFIIHGSRSGWGKDNRKVEGKGIGRGGRTAGCVLVVFPPSLNHDRSSTSLLYETPKRRDQEYYQDCSFYRRPAETAPHEDDPPNMLRA